MSNSLKKFQSPIYRKAAKRMVARIKSLNPLMERIPAPLPKPDSPALTFARKAEVKEVTAAKLAYQKADQFRADKDTLHYWISPIDQEV